MPNKFDLDSDFVRKLAKLLEETGLSEIEYAEGDRKIRCSSARGPAPVMISPGVAGPAPQAAAPNTSDIKPVTSGTPITSPMVGTVYLAASPGAAPFITAGQKVNAGDTLLIIEAMKVMNPIKAQKAGTIAEILVTDSQPVEFGETLLTLA